MEYKNEQHVENRIISENDEPQQICSKSIEDIINKVDIINFISSNLYSIIHNNKQMKKRQSRGDNEPFYSKNIPVLSLNKYLIRIMKYTECENNTLIVGYLYVMKLIQKENFVLGINNVYRLLLGAIVLAKKFMEDIKYDNSYYCNIGGISNQELNLIEYSLFTRIDFSINLQKKDIDKIYEQIFKALPKSRLDEILKINNINNNINNNTNVKNEVNNNSNNKNKDVKNKESQKEKKDENNNEKTVKSNNNNNSSNIKGFENY